mmetsp:Transcript_71771/g.198125  ORF Transcript_71771/g.198125 Transcript_71771/m.198125 type:complete len:328 (-) Transcript_71771:87-1070(-)|eukprot:CAMPEP_0179188714 /NCGR_PEP_ID=MMETSP0796-20121207/93669_1 /TAXON_ID=73915 /ORGANISM="Pyrodinium bahamense, Strain pbaha01" /LENGTH=327 /DNA_ID=CAMNT_0020892827 /DNA_START=70 /DNA_END=1053 /DNA_ORIENTATION=-
MADAIATQAAGVPAAEAAAASEIRKPKKPITAYWLFTNKVREEITAEIKTKNGGKANFGEIAKATSARWAALAEADKKEFEDKVEEDKKRYAEEFKAYLEASDPAGTLRNKYAHLIPKKPMTAYFLFSQDPAQREKAVAALREAGSEANNKQLASKLGEMWKAASAEDKAPFEERHKQEQAEFLKKQMEWQATPEFAEIEAAAKKQAEQQKTEGQQEGGQESKGAKRSRSSAKAASPKDESKAGAQESPVSAAKRAKKATPAKEEAAIDADVLAEANKLGLDCMLRNLASRPEVVASGKSSREVFNALQAAGGLVNPAKRALMAAGA